MKIPKVKKVFPQLPLKNNFTNPNSNINKANSIGQVKAAKKSIPYKNIGIARSLRVSDVTAGAIWEGSLMDTGELSEIEEGWLLSGCATLETADDTLAVSKNIGMIKSIVGKNLFIFVD